MYTNNINCIQRYRPNLIPLHQDGLHADQWVTNQQLLTNTSIKHWRIATLLS